VPQRRRRPDAVCRRGPRQIEALCTLRFTEEELAYLRGLRFIKSDFVDFLGLFQLNTSTSTSSRRRRVRARSASSSGAVLHTILFEIPVLAIVNEVTSAARRARPTSTPAAAV